MSRLAVFVSGNGSNLQALIDATRSGALSGVELALVVCNRIEAFAIKRAVKAGIPVIYFPLLPYNNAGRPRSDYDADLVRLTKSFDVDWIVLAGWMHIFTPAFLTAYPNRILNLHPALPGTFPGTQAIERAYEAFQRGEITQTGVMVHLVPDAAVDAGPVVAQASVAITPEDTLDDLEARIHETEHSLLVDAVRRLCSELR